jgi:hypothetical protein
LWSLEGYGGDRLMMRTIEVFLVIIIITGAFIIASFYAVLPIPRRVSPMNLREVSFNDIGGFGF